MNYTNELNGEGDEDEDEEEEPVLRGAGGKEEKKRRVAGTAFFYVWGVAKQSECVRVPVG